MDLKQQSPPKTIVPHIPENAPFSQEQRSWLNGYLAGLFSVQTLDNSGLPQAQREQQSSAEPLTILFGSQTGTSESLAKQTAKIIKEKGVPAKVFDMEEYALNELANEKNLLIITSTYGDGEMPDNAQAFWDFLASDQAPKFKSLNYSVLALGDSNYPDFCAAGKNFDQRLAELGGTVLHPRVDCDVEYDEPYENWLNGVVRSLEGGANKSEPAIASQAAPVQEQKGYSKKNPFPAKILENINLSGGDSGKEIRHFSISLEGSGMQYKAGDALGVFPQNCPKIAEEILEAARLDGDQVVDGKPLRTALIEDYDITQISLPVMQTIVEHCGAPKLESLLESEHRAALNAFLEGRELIDLLLEYSEMAWTAERFTKLLRNIQPRLYSISSSPKAHAGEVHITVGVVRYQSHGRSRKGVCSTFLAERADGTVPVYMHGNKNFFLPENGATPIIMVGPGTGIAPFRGFLHERKATGASGEAWLFFGDQHEKADFIYKNELDALQKAGALSKVSTAFSRDQKEKIYVQHRMREFATELFEWLEKGAYFYVCGDATRMAKDVDAALHQVIETAGGISAEQAAEYVQNLKKQKRYQRDVY